MPYRIGEVATMSRISIRTLRHYDEIGLLCPVSRNDAGYRLYTDSDLEKLKQILFFKTLSFSLEAIGKALNDPSFDFHHALRDQRQQLLQQQQGLNKQLQLIGNLLTEYPEETTMNTTFAAFENFDPEIYEEEVQQRWGDSDAFRESAKRTKVYSESDWKEIKAENKSILQDLAALLRQGVVANNPQAIAAVEAYRLHIDRWYYPCSKRMHANLGLMYIEDNRFKENFEKIEVGLAQFICEAAKANAGIE